MRRVTSIAILLVTGMVVQEAIGALEVCPGQQGGCEVAVHAMRHIFSEPNAEAVLLIDATNAFDQLNQQVALQTSCIYVMELHQQYSQHMLFKQPAACLLMRRPYTQRKEGDRLLAVYAIAVPFIHQLDATSLVRQV